MKRTFYAAAAIGVLSVAYFLVYFAEPQSDLKPTPSTLQANVPQSAAPTVDDVNQTDSNPEKQQEEPELRPPDNLREISEKFDLLAQAHGFPESVSQFYPLSKYELDQLVEAADVNAITYKASKLMSHRPAEARELFLDAAALGSTYALVTIAELHQNQMAFPDNEIAQAFGPKVTDAYAYALAASKLGNEANASPMLAKIDANFSASETVKMQACKKANSVIQAVEERRISMGLGYMPALPRWPSQIKGYDHQSICGS